ncbi:MAG: MFS transporter [Chloroflexota bacterium]|jgi:MFS family permease
MSESARPKALLPVRQLTLMAAYWFGINAVWGGYEWFGQAQIELIVGESARGLTTGVLETLGALVAIAVVPTMGVISDYTTSRFGKRKGYIITGSFFDLLFLTGLALLALAEPPGWDGEALGSTGLLALYAVFFLSLQFSSNFAQGPYQGYVPDLVAEPQVGIASGAVGVMRTLGNIGGAVIMLGIGNGMDQWGLALFLIGVIEFTLAALTFVYVHEGPEGRSRQGRSWLSIAQEAWGLDVLRERSFVRMTSVRFLFLMGTGIFINVSKWYLDNSMGLSPDDQTRWGFVALGAAGIFTALAAIPAARISNRVGRKPVIWAACLIAGIGLALIAIAPSPPMAVAGLAFMGAGSGAYLAVDWALMTETIPLITSGRYMGLANIANSISGPIGLLLAGHFIIDAFTRAGLIELGPRFAVAVGIPALAVAAVVLIGVHPRRDPRDPEPSVDNAAA